MAMSLKEQLAAQLQSNNQEMEKAKAEVKKPVATKPSTPAPKAEEKKVEKKTVNTVKPSVEKTEKNTVAKTEKKVEVKPQETKKESKPASAKAHEAWVNQTDKELNEIASDDERVYRPITVDVENWRYVDEMARTLSSDLGRKVTHNDYVELLIKKEVDEYNSLSEKEKNIVQATVSLKKRTNKTKTIGLRENYWNAFDQLCIIHGHCPKCNMINLLIDKDIAKDHPKAVALNKIIL